LTSDDLPVAQRLFRVKTGRPEGAAQTSALGGKADEIGAKTDIEGFNLPPKYCWLLGWFALVRPQIRQDRAESILGGFEPEILFYAAFLNHLKCVR
jgi:hypothetical protein